jgi:hypothetical protein
MTYPASGTLRFRREPTLAGAGLILLTPQHFAETAYLGTLFLANFVGSALAAFGINRGLRWGWALGALVAGAHSWRTCSAGQWGYLAWRRETC